jgi:hypothetical protein
MCMMTMGASGFEGRGPQGQIIISTTPKTWLCPKILRIRWMLASYKLQSKSPRTEGPDHTIVLLSNQIVSSIIYSIIQSDRGSMEIFSVRDHQLNRQGVRSNY